jgi:hypothetical protein
MIRFVRLPSIRCNQRLTRPIQPTQKTARLIRNDRLNASRRAYRGAGGPRAPLGRRSTG